MVQKKSIKPFGIAVVVIAIIWFLAAVFAARYLAAWLYDVHIPDRHQIRSARAIIAAPFALPFMLAVAWLWWHQRRDDRAMRRQARFAPTFENPGHELRLDRNPADVD